MKFFTETILKRHKKVIYKIKRFTSILLMIFIALASVASSFFVYPVQKVQAADCADPVAPEVFIIDKPELDPALNEKLRYYVSYKPAALAAQCKTIGVTFRIYIYDKVSASLPATGYTTYQEREGRWNEAKGIYEGGGEIETGLWTQFTNGGYIFAYVDEKGDGTFTVSEQVGPDQGFRLKAGSGPHQTPPDFPVINTAEGYNTFALNSFGISITSLAKEYRIAMDNPTEVNLRYKLAWEDPSKAPALGSSYLDVNDTGNPDPVMRAVYAGYHYKGNKLDCLGGKVYIASPINPNCEEGDLNKSRGTSSNQLPTPVLEDIKIPFDTIKAKITEQPVAGKPAKVSMMLFPIIDLDYSNLATIVCPSCLNTDKALSNRPLELTVTIFATEEELNNTPCTESPDPAHPQECGGEATATGTDTTSPADKDSTANNIVNFIAKVIGTILWFIQVLIFTLFAEVILPLLVALLSIRTYTDAFALVILPGWELLRNLANVFFIVVLLVIGLATLFRVQKYQYRSLLVNLILAALLVNFSLIITQSVVAVAETVQHQFLPEEDKGIAIRVIANKLMIPPLEQGKITPAEFTAQGRLSDSLSKLIFPFFYLSLAIMAFIVMASLVFFVLVRMLVIWVLLMTSPLAFVAWILPDTKQWSSKWFSYLIKYAFFVAIIAFFLNISAYVSQKQGGVLLGLYKVNESSSLADFLSRIATNIFVMGFLIAGIYFAQSSSVIGAKTLGKYAKMGGQLPFKALAGAGKLAGGGAKALGERGFEGIQNTTGVTLDPREWKKGYAKYIAERGKEKEERLRERKLGKNSWVGKAFGDGVGAATASPEQFLENLASAKGAKTMLKKITGRRDKLKEKEEAAKQRAEGVRDIMTEDEREYLGEELDRLRSEHNQGGLQHGNDGAKELSDQIDDELDKIQKQKQELAKGSDPDKANKNKELDKQAQAWEKAKEELEKSDSGEVDVDEIKKGLEAIDGTVAAEFVKKAEAIKDNLPESKNNTEEIENLEKSMKKDDELRVANGFSEFDSAQPPGYVKFASKEKSDIDTALSKASQAAGEMNFQRLMKAAVETSKDEAKIEADFKDRGIHDDHGALIAEFDAAYGKKNQKDIQAVVQKLIAANGYTGQMLEHYGYDKDALGMRKFMEEKMGIEEKSADKRSLALLSKLDEINRKNGNHGLGSMTQRVGQNIVMRTVESQAAAYGKEVANQNTNSFLQSPDTNILASKVNKTTGKTTERITDPAVKRIKNMSGSDAVKLISRMSPGVRRRIVKSENYQTAGFNPTIKAALEGRYKK